jgi:hypothetical protein
MTAEETLVVVKQYCKYHGIDINFRDSTIIMDIKQTGSNGKMEFNECGYQKIYKFDDKEREGYKYVSLKMINREMMLTDLLNDK